MAIPRNINNEHIHLAIRRIELEGVRPKRQARDYAMSFEGKVYPCKLIISLANEYANGIVLKPAEFNTTQAQKYLKDLGFKIIELHK